MHPLDDLTHRLAASALWALIGAAVGVLAGFAVGASYGWLHG